MNSSDVHLEVIRPSRVVIRNGVRGSGIQVLDDVLQQGDHHNPLTAAVLVAEATHAITGDDQLDCLVIPPDQDWSLFSFLR